MLPSNLPARLRAAGLTVVEISGWEKRRRPNAFAPRGVLWHHTGGKEKPGTEGAYARWMFLEGRDDLPAPLCQLSIDRNGIVYVGAAGRANHAGKAKASGTMPAGDGNELYVGVECHNDGKEGWSPAQYAAMVATGRVLSAVLKVGADRHRAHRETSVTGKWDPGLLDMDRFRADLASTTTPTQPESEEDDMKPDEREMLIKIAKQTNENHRRLADTQRAVAEGLPLIRLVAKAVPTILRQIGYLMPAAEKHADALASLQADVTQALAEAQKSGNAEQVAALEQILAIAKGATS